MKYASIICPHFKSNGDEFTMFREGISFHSGIRFIAAERGAARTAHSDGFSSRNFPHRRSSESALREPPLSSFFALSNLCLCQLTDCRDTRPLAEHQGGASNERGGAWHAKNGIESVPFSPGCQSATQFSVEETHSTEAGASFAR